MKKAKNKALENTKKLALASLFAAICFIAMYIGCLTQVLDLCAVTLSSLVIIVSVIEIGGIYPWLIWAVAGTLCLIILPDKYVALEFILYGGIYPMIKAVFERLPKAVSWILKIVYFNAVFTLSVFAAKYVFGLTDIGFELKWVAYIAANVFFIMSDICFTVMISAYVRRIRPRLRIDKQK